MRTRGVTAAAVAVAAAGALATVGVTGASGELANQTFYANEGLCFTTDPAATCPVSGDPAEVTIQAGEAADVTFPGGAGTAPHNAVASSGNWTWTSDPPSSDPRTKTTPVFNTNGDYAFVCAVHGGMRGVIHVQGGSTPTPTPTPTPSVTPTPTPTTHGSDTTTPSPSPTVDTVKPTVRRLHLKTLRHHAARLTFTLSENATLTIRVKRGHRVLKTVRVQARKGTHSVKLRGLKKGRYTIDIRARDAVGNRSALATKRLRVRR